jgi:DNA-binding transcriptional LysR family regulator
MPEFGTGDLMILRAIAQRGSFTAAARELGYTQSAISRRAAVLEATAGRPLFQRRPAGVQLTDAGEVLLRHATVVLSALDAAARELQGLPDVRSEPIRLGAFASAAAGLVPSALRALADTRPDLRVVLREGTTAAMVRALRAGTVDMVVVASTQPFRPLDDREPPLAAEVLAERDLLVAVGPRHRLAGRSQVDLDELAGERWIAARSEGDEHLLGVWPGLPGRPDVPFIVRDWLTKLRLVASGAGITTIPAVLLPALPADVHHVAVRDEPRERRRLVLVHAPSRPPTADAKVVAAALRAAAASPGPVGAS